MAETTLYDVGGNPSAYIADDGESIYLWTGQAVALVVGEKVYRWRGDHVGWFVDGIVYDGSGRRAGFTAGRLPVAAHASPAKHAKHARPARGARHAAFARPCLSTAHSSTSLVGLLRG